MRAVIAVVLGFPLVLLDNLGAIPNNGGMLVSLTIRCDWPGCKATAVLDDLQVARD